MNEKIKNYLGIAIIVAVFLFAAGYLSYVNVYSKSVQPGSYRSFSVSGEGIVTAIPDIAQFVFSVITQGGEDIAALQSENVENTNNAIDYLKEQGVDEKDIKTLTYNVEPRYQYFECRPTSGISPCPPSEIVGYTITQTVSVKVREFSKIGSLISGVADNGANSVTSLFFTIDDPSSLQDQARVEAIAKAKEKAELIAQAGGFSVGRLLSIDEGYVPFYGYGMGGADVAKLESSAVPTIEPGSQEITVSVILRYEIR